jgi:hypothetical protein
MKEAFETRSNRRESAGGDGISTSSSSSSYFRFVVCDLFVPLPFDALPYWNWRFSTLEVK